MAKAIRGEPMTLSTFSPTNANGSTSASEGRVRSGSVASNVGRVVRSAAASVGKAIIILVAYRAALKRLEAGAENNLFDDPVRWAELKSVAWAEAGGIAEHWKKTNFVRIPAHSDRS
jgi:hypothetical protein